MKTMEKKGWAEEMALIIKDHGWDEFIKESIKLGHIDETKIEWTYNLIINGLSVDEMWELCALVRDAYEESKKSYEAN
jgi:hypothetical protein